MLWALKLMLYEVFNTLNACFFLVVIAIMCVFFKKELSEYRLIFNFLAGLIFLRLILIKLNSVFSEFRKITQTVTFHDKHFLLIAKIIIISCIVQFIISSLNDAGETALAFEAEIVGKILIIYEIFPIFTDFITLIYQTLA